MPPIDAKNKPDFRNDSLKCVQPFIDIVRDVSAGTQRMREKSTAYLPKEKREADEDYQFRLKASVLFGGYRKTVDALVGLVCKDEIKLGDDVPAEIATQLEDVDLKGNHLDVFVKQSFTDQFEGASIYLVDMPPQSENVKTRADEIANGRRPYWVHYKRDQVINYRIAKVGGEYQFTLIVFEEVNCEPDGDYGETQVTRYRVFRRNDVGQVSWELFRKEELDETKRFEMEDSGTITLNRIPVAVSGGLDCKPALIDIANLNISHWRNNSDQENILHITRVPILVRVGGSGSQKEMTVGISSTVDVPTDGDLKWLEVSETGAMAVGRQHLLDIEKRMGVLGISQLSPDADPVQRTATEVHTEDVKQLSHLATMARSEKDAIEQCLGYHAQYLGLDSGGSITLGAAEGEKDLTSQDVTALLSAVTSNNLSQQTFLEVVLSMLNRAGVLAEAVTVDDETARIDKQKQQAEADQLKLMTKQGAANAGGGVRPLFGAQSGGGAVS